MRENSYYVLEEKSKRTGKYYAFAAKEDNNTNLLYAFRKYLTSGFDIVSINACKTMKEAKKIAADWNDMHKQNGRYAFDETF